MKLPYFALLAFLASASAFLVVYIDSTIAAQIVGEQYLFPLYALGAGISVFFFFLAPSIVSRIGNGYFLVSVAAVRGLSLLLIGAGLTGPWGAVALLGHFASAALIGFSLDIFFEKATAFEGLTGRARGTILSMGNLALVISPIIAGIIVERFSYEAIYLIALFVFCAFLLVAIPHVRSFVDPRYKQLSLISMKRALLGENGAIFFAHFVLRIYYAWMAILMPLYLHEVLGLSWAQTGIVLSITLLPFFLFEFPLGKLADSKLREKEILIVGYIVVGLSLFLLSFIPQYSLYLIIACLFVCRIGAAMVEVATETNFFRTVRAGDDDAIMLFRVLQPAGFLVGAPLAYLVFKVTPFVESFMLFGIFVLLGVIVSLFVREAPYETPKP